MIKMLNIILINIYILKTNNMIKENNTKSQLRKLWQNDRISTKEYFFRLKAKELNINTYKFI